MAGPGERAVRSSGASGASVSASRVWPEESRASQRPMEATWSRASTGSPSWKRSPGRRRMETRHAPRGTDGPAGDPAARRAVRPERRKDGARMEDLFESWTEWVAVAVEAAAVLIIALASAEAAVRAVVVHVARPAMPDTAKEGGAAPPRALARRGLGVRPRRRHPAHRHRPS